MPLPKDPVRRKKVAKAVVSLMKLKPLVRAKVLKEDRERRQMKQSQKA